MKSDYKPSAHQVGAPPHHVSGRLVLSSLIAVVFALLVLNVFFPDPPAVSCDKPAQVSAPKK